MENAGAVPQREPGFSLPLQAGLRFGARILLKLPDLGQELAAGRCEPRLVLLQAAEDRHIALAEVFAAQLVGARFARNVAALANIVLCTRRRYDRRAGEKRDSGEQ